ncbi:hypothetical protein [Deinococcus sp. S9]|uniref:hypothetical protein n=1 Tax=Deinococcus sp. S9 TaxID=2545754 RepID=UPI0010554C3C|nr:hypothetical protein [Deinococcus sp. S9]TDE85562.1 hypothetical protein E0686_11155 [Deinococcus sp. S9]
MPEDMQAPQPVSLAAALRNRRPTRPAPRPEPQALPAEQRVERDFQQAITQLQAAKAELPVLEPELIEGEEPEQPPAWLEGLTHRLEARVQAEVTRIMLDATTRLAQEAKTAERAQVRLDESLSRAVKASPETIAMLEAENKRHLSEIQSLQAELERTRRAMRQIVGGGMKSFWRSQGRELGALASDCFDLVDVAPMLTEGAVAPEVGRRILAFLRTVGGVLEAYADNCLAYAEDAENE